MDRTVRNTMLTFLIVLIFYLMMELSTLLIPLALAFLCAVLFQPIIAFLKKSRFPNWLIFPTVSVISLLILYGIINLFISTISEISSQQDFFLERLSLRSKQLIVWINDVTGLHITFYEALRTLQKEVFNWKLLSPAMGSFASEIGAFTGSLLMFSIYYLVLLKGLANYKEFFAHIGKGMKNTSLLEDYEKIQKSIISYVGLKTMINLFAGLVVGLVCWAFGLKFAIFVGLITFALHFIPNIGSILTIVIPSLLAIIQFDSTQTIILFLLIIVVSMFVIGNFVEPKIMSNKLSINTLTVIFGLVFWGYIWGIPGMMLSVPLLVIVKLVLEHVPDLSIVARLMESPRKEK